MKTTLISVLAVSALVVTLAPSSSHARRRHHKVSRHHNVSWHHKPYSDDKRHRSHKPYRSGRPYRYSKPYRYRNHGRYRAQHTMAGRSFRSYLHSLSDLIYGSSMLDALRSDATHLMYTARQVRKILSLFSFDNNRLRALTILAPRIVDPANSVVIYDRFSFNRSRRKARHILARVYGSHHARL